MGVSEGREGESGSKKKGDKLGTKGKVCACVYLCILSKSTYSRQSFLVKLTRKL